MRACCVNAVVASLLAISLFGYHAEGPTYKVLVHAEGEEVAQGMGVLVADELLLTATVLVDQGDQAIVEDPATGARYVASLRTRSTSLALLSVPGLTGDAASLAAQAPTPGASVHLLLMDGTLREGILHSESSSDSVTAGRSRFTMPVNANETGAPLMNNCGHLLSVSTGMLESGEGAAEISVGLGGTHLDLVAFLTQDSVTYEAESTPCLSVEEQLAQAKVVSTNLVEERRSLEEELRSLEDSSKAELQLSAERLAELSEQRTLLERRVSETSARLVRQDSIIAEKTDLQTELDSIREQHDLAQTQIQDQAVQARRRLYLVGGIGAGLLLIAALLLWSLWRRRRDAQDELLETDARLREAEAVVERKSATCPDILLSGSGPKGEEIRIKVNGSVLAQSDKGAVIGRSSSHADYVLIENSVSRSHARIGLTDNRITMEDLGSLNGTIVNGTKLTPGLAHPLSSGMMIALGDVDLKVTIFQK